MSRYCFVPLAQVSECMLSHINHQTIDSVRRTVLSVSPAECSIEYEGEKHECLSLYEDVSVEEADLYMSNTNYSVPFGF